ncbi:MAG TPA: hypothetical protein VGJ81_17310 [Thermoanaerobaculia bacterium]
MLVVEIRQRQGVFVFGLEAEEVFEGRLDGRGLVLLEVNVPVDRHAGSGGDEAADDDVLL